MADKKKMIPLGLALEIANRTIEFIESRGAHTFYPKATIEWLVRNEANNPDLWKTEDWPNDGTLDGYDDRVFEGAETSSSNNPFNENEPIKHLGTEVQRKHKYTGMDSGCARRFRIELQNCLSRLRSGLKKNALPQRRKRRYGKVATRNVPKANEIAREKFYREQARKHRDAYK